jgi:CBS domain-containing protein
MTDEHTPTAGKTSHDLAGRTVREVMTRGPITIAPDAPLAAAAAVLHEREIRHLPVVDEAGRVVGILSDRDVRGVLLAPVLGQYLSARGQRSLRSVSASLQGMRVRDAMTWDAVVIEPTAPLVQAAAIMFEGRFGCLPVVERGVLVGIVTERDVLKAIAAFLPSIRGSDPDSYFW